MKYRVELRPMAHIPAALKSIDITGPVELNSGEIQAFNRVGRVIALPAESDNEESSSEIVKEAEVIPPVVATPEVEKEVDTEDTPEEFVEEEVAEEAAVAEEPVVEENNSVNNYSQKKNQYNQYNKKRKRG